LQKYHLTQNENVSGSVTGICIALNYLGKCKRKMVIRGIKLTGKQPAVIELTRRNHSTDARLHYHYIRTSDMGVRRISSRGVKVDILLIFFRLLAMQRKWTYTKIKCPMLREQLPTVFSL